ncbi:MULTISPECIES: M48 family metallopeptidase [Halobacterium]|uniref:M48 family metallopeptidase n=1 Tax=Halobacterium TaxID=2239 RepID=UPI00073EB1E1|nr:MULTISPECIES: SprT family zinc-dependent metalloprotease [Halobacterium]MCG1001893.1 M48 family metallopeptidase [Halobacterium noricense]
MAKADSRSIDLLGKTVEYDVQRSTEASEPRIDVDIHGVTVVLPDSEEVQPATLLKENAAWVVDKRQQYEAHREQVPDRTFAAGEQFPYLGEPRTLVVAPCRKHSVQDDTIRLRQSAVEQSSVEQVLENFYRGRARDYLTDRADHYAEQMGVDYEALELRNQRTRWGSCSTNGTLSLNWRIIMAPPDVVDYLLVHELAHLTEQHHGEEFWKLVADYVPDYQAKDQWLTENSVKLIFSEDDL